MRTESDAPPEPRVLRTGPLALLRGILDRPLASYYLLLSSVGLLVLIGLVMVFSVTSLDAYAQTGNPFTVIVRQLFSAIVGLGAFWLFQRLPARTFQALSRRAGGRGCPPAASPRSISARSTSTTCGCTSAPSRCSRPSWPSWPSCCGAPTSSYAKASGSSSGGNCSARSSR